MKGILPQHLGGLPRKNLASSSTLRDNQHVRSVAPWNRRIVQPKTGNLLHTFWQDGHRCRESSKSTVKQLPITCSSIASPERSLVKRRPGTAAITYAIGTTVIRLRHTKKTNLANVADGLRDDRGLKGPLAISWEYAPATDETPENAARLASIDTDRIRRLCANVEPGVERCELSLVV